MALTQIDPHVALIVIDLQKGIVGLPTAHDIGPVIRNASALAAAFRSRGLPVVLVIVAGGAPGRVERTRAFRDFPPDWTELVGALDPQPTDHRVTKQTWGAFTATDLAAYLGARGVTQVVLAGVATSAGVESTARHAHELGFNVTLAIDAMTDTSREAHDNSVALIFPRLGETGTTPEIIARLGPASAAGA